MTAVLEAGRELLERGLERAGRGVSRMQEMGEIPADLLESDAEYHLLVDAAGASAEDVAVRAVGRTVTVEIDRFRSFDPDYILRYPGRGMQLSTSVELPAAIDPDGAEATVDQTGTLSVRIPKRSPTTAVTVAEE
jgi:Molecular chaperone (small heat shock protein)